ncbi:unnamed protein product [Rotaria sp. Silwood1]|nr:unnamed protein product [Rotaria sp. Silwood1]
MDTFVSAYDEKIRPLMDKIDQARSLLSWSNDGITFPNVVVVGDQSSGKSTLLESLSLVELPKGSGIVTRCPLVLRLRKASVRRLYRLNGNKKIELDERKTNILNYIEEETKKLAGENKNIVKDLIELQVNDPNVRDLTVVDLPGIARNPIADQPKDIHKQTTDLIRHLIRQEGSVILCVFPANVDIATVESFTIAREVDPTGIRTIGVITKSDLASNHDTLIQQLLMDRPDVFHLKLGFIAVRNRSTEEEISLEDARKREKEFFSQHPASRMTGHCLGIDALINRLADLYSDRVKETFPKMRNDIQTKLKEVRDQLSKFPPDLASASARLAKYYELADWYVENIIKERFESSNDGQHTTERKSGKTGEKMCFSKITDDDDDDDNAVFDAISNDDQAVQDMIISIYAYWKLLIKRFIDYTALSIRAGCVFDICPGIRERLRQIPIEQPDFVDAYLAEDTFIRAKREQLHHTKERLEKVDAILGGGRIAIDDNDTFASGTMSIENSPAMTLDKLEENLASTNVIENVGPSGFVPNRNIQPSVPRVAQPVPISSTSDSNFQNIRKRT